MICLQYSVFLVPILCYQHIICYYIVPLVVRNNSYNNTPLLAPHEHAVLPHVLCCGSCGCGPSLSLSTPIIISRGIPQNPRLLTFVVSRYHICNIYLQWQTNSKGGGGDDLEITVNSIILEHLSQRTKPQLCIFTTVNHYIMKGVLYKTIDVI